MFERLQKTSAAPNALILEVVNRHAVLEDEIDEATIEKMRRDFYVSKKDSKLRVYYRLTDNWSEMSARFLSREHGSRERKYKMSREILDCFENENIEIATSSFEVLGTTSIRLSNEAGDGKNV